MLSNREAHLVGDILDESRKALSWTEDIDEAVFLASEEKVYSVAKAIQNATEACIQLDGKDADGARFEDLFPGFTLHTMRTIGNRLRHDYAGYDAQKVWDALPRMEELNARAGELLDQHRRLHGRASD
ncbi:MAG: HepT-like ribonuclease domain-containing protein [Pseudomonadota bacterium]